MRQIGQLEFGPVRFSLSADDLEGYGPTLLDHTEEGYHLVLWTE